MRQRAGIWGRRVARAVRERFHPSADRVTRKNTRSAYERLYGSETLLRQYLSTERLRFYEELAARCAPLAKASVIDVGCGAGHLLRALADRVGPDTALAGVDHADRAIERARELLPEARWRVGDLYALDQVFAGERFDLVLCVEVLEHLSDPDRAVRELLKICSRSGRVAVTVPDGDVDTWPGHVNFWNERELASFLGAHGRVEIDRIEDGATLLALLAPG